MTPEAFVALLSEVTGAPNPEQEQCLLYGLETPCFIVAGPGSGKTRVLVQRALRHALVDKIPPEQVIITTFTKKAAKEIRSRLVDWGEPALAAAREKAATSGHEAYCGYLESVDVNRFVTGTLDSLCEEALEISRTPSEPRYTLLDEFAARTQLSRRGKLYDARQTKPQLNAFLAGFTLDGQPPGSTGDAARDLKFIADRLIHDLVDEAVFADTSDGGRHAALEVVGLYGQFMEETSQLDFARLERTIRDRIKSGRDVGPLTQARAVLVDEYQDTNLLQEQIYFELVRRQNAAFTVVGDDDQSLYRFRGATIELFRDFAARAQHALGAGPITPIYLHRNYRSTNTIVDFFNSFIVNDPDFSPGARVQPLKPAITPASGLQAFPVLGIFRDDFEPLAGAVADFLGDVFVNGGRAIPGTSQTLRATPTGGNFGDAVMLSKSVNEFGRAAYGKPPQPKFPHYLRTALEARGYRVFNPRGRPLREVPALKTLLGLVLETLDPSSATFPGGPIATGMLLGGDVKRIFDEWRAAGLALLAKNPTGLGKTMLNERMIKMRALAKPGSGPRDWPLLDAVYAFVPYLPVLSDDPEHQAYMEAVSRAAAQMVSFSAFHGLIIRSSALNKTSIEFALRDMLAPLAEGDIDIDEEIFSDPPRNCFNLMTIHQAKGLEFPLVLVDVSSECKTDHVKQRFKRFPDTPSGTTAIEDAFADFTEIGALRKKRTALQRSFEDITREYYVAYSRPQCVLVLIGNTKALATKTNIKHVGLFWRSNGVWPWTETYPAKKPPPVAQCPFILM